VSKGLKDGLSKAGHQGTGQTGCAGAPTWGVQNYQFRKQAAADLIDYNQVLDGLSFNKIPRLLAQYPPDRPQTI